VGGGGEEGTSNIYCNRKYILYNLLSKVNREFSLILYYKFATLEVKNLPQNSFKEYGRIQVGVF